MRRSGACWSPCGAPQGSGSGSHSLPASSSSWQRLVVEGQRARCWTSGSPGRVQRKSSNIDGGVTSRRCLQVLPVLMRLTCGRELLRSWKLAWRPRVLRRGVGSWFRLSVEPDMMVAWRQPIREGSVKTIQSEASLVPSRTQRLKVT